MLETVQVIPYYGEIIGFIYTELKSGADVLITKSAVLPVILKAITFLEQSDRFLLLEGRETAFYSCYTRSVSERL